MKTLIALVALAFAACSSSSGSSQCAGQSCVASADCCPDYSCANYVCVSGAAGNGTGGSSGSGGQGSTTGEASTGGGGSSTGAASTTGRASSTGGAASSTGAGSTTGAGVSSSGGGSSTGAATTSGGGSSSGGSTGGTCTSCPSGYACGTANGIPVCRNSQTGIPLFRHVFVIMMENTSASAITASATPYLSGLATQWATSSNYSGATDPSLPNYIAITSGDTQGIGCDCLPSGSSACDLSICANYLFNNSCNCGGMTVTHLGDQIDKAGLTWKNYGESMGTDCNPNGASPYAPKHVPFLYYQDVLSNSSTTYCGDHVVDFGNHFAADLAGTTPTFSIIAPNLNDDMHGTGALQTSQDITNGDSWLGQQVPPILSSSAFSESGIAFIVWDEGSLSLSPSGVPFYVLSPLAKKGGYVSSVKYDHYSLLATIEDGLGLARLGKAQGAAPLADFFPTK